LRYCNDTELTKIVLDCGAGGDCPPLMLFKDFGYETHGIEIDDTQLAKSDEFSRKHGLNLNISKGDIRNLDFKDESISFVYSYNTIFHMRKAEIQNTVKEMLRVLKPGGLCFVNVLSMQDHRNNLGTKIGEGEFLREDYDQPVVLSCYESNEADGLFDGVEIIYKEQRFSEHTYQGEKLRQGFIDYIVRK